MLHIYIGDGKGKTTAAIGLLIRALGAGLKCGFYSFLKTDASSELNVLRNLDNLEIFKFPEKVGFLWDMTEDEKKGLCKYYDKVLEEILKSDADVIVLDEAIDAICSCMINVESVIKLAKKCEVIITGRGNCEKLFDMADYITECKKIKHPYDKGEKARKGIEY